jgi:hypothetical protein
VDQDENSNIVAAHSRYIESSKCLPVINKSTPAAEREEMATWKRLNDTGARTIDVNMDLVLYMTAHDTYTSLMFGSGLGMNVSETPDEIHSKAAIGEFGMP